MLEDFFASGAKQTWDAYGHLHGGAPMLFFLREQNAFWQPVSVHEVNMKKSSSVTQSQQGLDAGGVLSEKSIADTDLPNCSHVIPELQKGR